MPKPISLAQQIEEVEREIKLRESVFQSYGRSGKMRSSEVEFHIARMKAVLTVTSQRGGDQGCGDKGEGSRGGKIEQRLCDLTHTPKHLTTAMLLQLEVEGIVRPLRNKYPETLRNKYPALNKGLVLIGTVLLIGLVLTPFAWHMTLGNRAGAGAMGRGGQFEKALLW